MLKPFGMVLLLIANLSTMGLFYFLLAFFFNLVTVSKPDSTIIISIFVGLTLLIWISFYFAAFRLSKGWLVFLIVWLAVLTPVCASFPTLLIIPVLYLLSIIFLWKQIPKKTGDPQSAIEKKKRTGKEEVILLLTLVPTLWATCLFFFELLVYQPVWSLLVPAIFLPLSWFTVWKLSNTCYTKWVYFLTLPSLLAIWNLLEYLRGAGLDVLPDLSFIPYLVSFVIQPFGYGLAIYLTWRGENRKNA